MRKPRKSRLERPSSETSKPTSNPTPSIRPTIPVSRISSNGHEVRPAHPYDRANDVLLGRNTNEHSRYRPDDNIGGTRTVGRDGILKDCGNSPNAGRFANGNSTGTSGVQTERERPVLIDKILEGEDIQDVYEEFGTLLVSLNP